MNHYTDDDLIDYLHGEVSDEVDARVHAHLARCGDCSARFDAQARLGEMLRASALAQERPFPPMIRAHVWASIRAAEPTPLERIRAFINPLVAVPVAAAFALLMYLSVPIVRGDRATAPTVAAAYYFEEHAAEGLENPLADHVNTNATLAFGQTSTVAAASSPLIDAADAATLDDLAASRE
jgi:predicted anti-sigma-YlaC factor YlaD